MSVMVDEHCKCVHANSLGSDRAEERNSGSDIKEQDNDEASQPPHLWFPRHVDRHCIGKLIVIDAEGLVGLWRHGDVCN